MIEIIPAIDMIDGRCVRLINGSFEQKTEYALDPVAAAGSFEAAGLRRLHMVDLDGARSGTPKNLKVLERVATATSLKIDFGGGLRTRKDLDSVFGAGAAMANVGSMAVRQPDQLFSWAEHYGAEKLLVGADARDGMIAVDGWRTQTEIDLIEFLSGLVRQGIKDAFVTDIAFDGAMAGPSLDLYRDIRKACPDLRLVASGGVRSNEDIDELERIGCTGVIIGKALYEGGLRLEELSRYVG